MDEERMEGPERAAGLSLWIYTTVWLWCIITQGTTTSWPRLPWYGSKCTPSFLDALAALRASAVAGKDFRDLAPEDALSENHRRPRGNSCPGSVEEVLRSGTLEGKCESPLLLLK